MAFFCHIWYNLAAGRESACTLSPDQESEAYCKREAGPEKIFEGK